MEGTIVDFDFKSQSGTIKLPFDQIAYIPRIAIIGGVIPGHEIDLVGLNVRKIERVYWSGDWLVTAGLVVRPQLNVGMNHAYQKPSELKVFDQKGSEDSYYALLTSQSSGRSWWYGEPRFQGFSFPQGLYTLGIDWDDVELIKTLYNHGKAFENVEVPKDHPIFLRAYTLGIEKAVSIPYGEWRSYSIPTHGPEVVARAKGGFENNFGTDNPKDFSAALYTAALKEKTPEAVFETATKMST